MELPAQPSSEPIYVKYTPTAGLHSNDESAVSQRLIKIQEAAIDPLAPPKRGKRIKRIGAPPSPPQAVLRSPPRKATKEELEAWKIPAAVSNWTNPRGYIIAIDKRVAMDDYMNQDLRPSERFAQISEALALSEEAGRIEIEKRNQIRRRLAEKETEEKERQLREQAHAARYSLLDRTSALSSSGGGVGVSGGDEDQDENVRDEGYDEDTKEQIRQREIQRKEREEEIRRSMRMRTRDRDISERVALNQSVVDIKSSTTSIYDERLFHNAPTGITAGMGGDGMNDQYETSLFTTSGVGGMNTLYRPTSETGKLSDASYAQANLDMLTSGGGSEGGVGQARKPVQFERDTTTTGEASGVQASVEAQVPKQDS